MSIYSLNFLNVKRNHYILLLSCSIPANILVFSLMRSASIDYSVESSPRRVALFRALFRHLPLAPFRHSGSGIAPSIEFFLFRFAATRSPTGLLPGPTVDPDAPTFPARSRNRQHTRARPGFQEARRGMPTSLTIRLRQRGSANFEMDPRGPRGSRESPRKRGKRRLEWCSCRESS